MIDGIISVKELINDLKEGRQSGRYYALDEDSWTVDVIDLLEVLQDYEIAAPEEWHSDIKTTVEDFYEGYKLTYAGNTYNDCCPLSNNLTNCVFRGEDGVIYAFAVNLSRDALGAYSAWVLFKFEDTFDLYEITSEECFKEIDFYYGDCPAYVVIEPFDGEYHTVHVPDLDLCFESRSIDLDEIRAEIEEELSTP